MTEEQKGAIRTIIVDHIKAVKAIDLLRDRLNDVFILQLCSTGIDPKEVQEIFLETTMKNIKDSLPPNKEAIDQFIDILNNI